MNYEYIESSIQGRIQYMTLNRPEKRNAFSFELVTELKSAFKEAGLNSDIRAIILNARGKAFCAGADLQYLQLLQKNSYEQNLADSQHLRELFEMIYRHPKLVIAQVEGAALAGGSGLASLCDYAFATEEASFGYTESKIGFIPAMVMVFLIRKLGESKARELLISGRVISAREAKEFGLIHEICPADSIHQRVLAFAEELLNTVSGNSISMIKEMFWELQGLNFSQALDYTASMNAKARASEDCQRGIQAFLNKEKITW